MRSRIRPLLALPFVALLALGLVSGRGVNGSAALPQADPEQGGSFPDRWINGVDCAAEPAIQTHAYNEDLYILRQSKCSNFEAPFLYLLFGEDTALLMDTGSVGNPPVRQAVFRVIDEWLARNERESIHLVVAHTHSHFDHVANDAQFQGLPNVTVVGLSAQAVEGFWGFQDYPHDQPTFDLGGRVLDVIGTPGHQGQSVTLYDRRTQLLLTGDIVYPGHLFTFSDNGWNQFRKSLQRLVAFARVNPIEWVLGCHIEMTSTPGVPYQYGETSHPDERVLELHPRVLIDVLRARNIIGDDPQCAVFDDFLLHPVHVCGFDWPF